MSDFKYWAFLSYSHTDRKWGDWLHKALETYRVPRRLVGSESRDGKVPERVYPIFRDREELPVSADLGSNINGALRESRYLIVICSPRSAQSRWVGEEIKTYKKLGREDRILAMIVDGEPNASDGKPGFKVGDECFHEALRYRWSENGQPASSVRSEPIAADAREGKDGKSNAKLKLLAGLLGVNYDDLKQREQERRLRRARIIVVSVLVLLSAFVALAVALFFKEREATQQRDEVARARDAARATMSRSDFLQALRSIKEEKDFDALAQLTRSLSFDSTNKAAATRLITLLEYRDYALPVSLMRHDGDVLSAEFSPDGKRIVTASEDNSARVWDTQNGKPLTDPMKHDKPVESAEFSPDGRWIVTSSEDKTARVWDSRNGRPVSEPMRHDSEVLSARFSPDGKRVATASRDETARIWDAESGRPLTEPMKHGNIVCSAEFSPDGKRIVTASWDYSAHIWDAVTGQSLFELKHDSAVCWAEFSPDGKKVVTASYDKAARIWDAQTGHALTAPMMHHGAVWSAKFSPDGKKIVTAPADGIAHVWDAETGRSLAETATLDGEIRAARFSPDSKRIVTASDDKTARLWDAASGKSLAETMLHGEAVRSACFSPDGKSIVTASNDKTARVWNIQKGKSIAEAMNNYDPRTSIPITPSGKRIVIEPGGKAAQVWDTGTAKPVSKLMKHADTIRRAQFSPDGKRVLTASADKTARVWDANTGNALTEPMEHDGEVSLAQFSPDGQRIMTVDEENLRVRVWDAESGKPLTEPLQNDRDVLSGKFSPDNKRIMISLPDKTGQAWDISPNGQICPDWVPRLAEAIAGRHLSDLGMFEPLNSAPAAIIEGIKNTLNSRPANDEWAVWGKWFLADRSNRTISPFSASSIPQYIEGLIKENTSASLDEAQQLAVGNAELVRLITEAQVLVGPSQDEAITIATKKYVGGNSVVSDIRVRIEKVDGDFARVLVIPAHRRETDAAWAFLRRENGVWRGLSLGTAFDTDFYDEFHIPVTVQLR